MVVYPVFPVSARRVHSVPALWRTAVWIGLAIGKIMLVIALAAFLGVFVGAALGFVVVVALI
jgi:Mg/Co/Ni transporter MgtE